MPFDIRSDLCSDRVGCRRDFKLRMPVRGLLPDLMLPCSGASGRFLCCSRGENAAIAYPVLTRRDRMTRARSLSC
jgi:hypothetical protein